MDPYKKGLKISVTVHVLAILGVLLAIVWNDLFKPRPAAVFTVMAPPSGLIAGGPATTPRAPSPVPTAPQSPKMPSPAPTPEPAKVTPSEVIPHDDFLEAAPPQPVKKKSDKGIIKPKPQPKKISYAEWVKQHPQAKATAKPKPQKKSKTPPSAIAPASTPSFEENLASRLDKRIQEDGDTPVGTGLGGAPGSGVVGMGTAGAINDADTIYSGTIYTYLNSVWEEPKEVGSVHLYAKVEFSVSKDGTITQWQLTRSSGSDSFDKSVARVFAKIKTVTAPPTPQSYTLSVVFETRDS